jgi:predicted transcriptional regulator
MLHSLKVLDLMNDRIAEVHTGETVGEVARKLLRTNVAGARVVDDPPGDFSHAHHRTAGVVTAWELAERAAQGDAQIPVQAVMLTDWPKVHPEDDAAKALDALACGDAAVVVVVDGRSEIIGLVTPDDLRRGVTIARIELARSSPSPP